MIKYAIFGGNGKMGKEVIKIAPRFEKNAILSKVFISPADKTGGVAFSVEEAEGLDFIIDFSTPSASINLAQSLAGKSVLIVCGTTGFTFNQIETLKIAAKNVKILYSANFSVGMGKVFKAVKNLAAALHEYKVEILEKHHALKKDAPSGTALTLGKIVQDSRSDDIQAMNALNSGHVLTEDEIKYNVIREGAISGFHEVSFIGEGERIWIGHESFKKEIFASGAIEWGIKAVTLLESRKNGFFDTRNLSFE